MSAPRGRALTVLAGVLTLLALADLLKPLHLEGVDTGFVLLGQRQTGTAGTIAGVVAGLYLATYAAGVWGLRRWALPMARAYAIYVTANVLLFPLRTPQPADAGLGYFVFGVVYTVLAIGGSWACAVLLGRRRPT